MIRQCFKARHSTKLKPKIINKQNSTKLKPKLNFLEEMMQMQPINFD